MADAIKDIVDDLRNANSKYVVIAGGDDVIPFFRYPDTSGLGPESQFSPPMLPDTPAGASLSQDQVQGQDAYGSEHDGDDRWRHRAAARPGRRPAGEDAGGDQRHDRQLPFAHNGTLPEPDTSLVTGYDFLADAADAVNEEFRAALPAQGAVSRHADHPS